ncbi:NADP-dependent oxidoreductase [Cryptosporangium aurantiacum]|uniref:NADPH:quinone reductase n=1 Tax=Cryptosporangium aurantiacum TaxID=134849 RepID=A0A1M7PFA3_9ACTN|nr:NADP-dependent oxidoreductase [Cryptosporangium aurantiacum]SHN15337.1 NADPH:quinone reductase [Cryptosporangium aurantiacum]
MRALAVDAVPASPVLTDVPAPQAEAGELLVKVAATSINGFDAATAAGYVQGMMEHRFPLVTGKDFAGVVESDAEGFAVGDQVFGVVTKTFLGTGSHGEYVTVPVAVGVTRVPEGLSLADAGALGLAGTAAIDALDAVALKPGETVLIAGATGGVGAIALQYAVAAGAQVIATARPGAEADFVRGLGGEAVQIIDYTADLAAQVTAPVDVVLHLAGDGAALAGLVARGGRLASTLGFVPEGEITGTAVMATPTRATLDRLAADAAAGRLRVPVTRRYAFDDAATAFADFGAGALGKLAIDVA